MDIQDSNNSQTEKLFSVKLFIFFVIGLLILSVAFNAYFIWKGQSSPRKIESSSNNQQSITKPESQLTTAWEKPDSNKRGFPIVESDKDGKPSLSLYRIDEKKLIPVNAALYRYGGGASGFGSSDPLVSPDMLYTAYIDDPSQRLMLLSNDSLTAIPLAPNGHVGYISEWSKDSKKIIYHVSEDSLENSTIGQGGAPTGKVTFDPNLNAGFFVVDIDSGTTQKLYPVEHFEAFMDNNRILVKTPDQSSYNKGLIVFDIQKFEADYTLINEDFGFGAGQYNFTKDGSKWTYTLSRNPTTDANIIYAPFPKKEDVTVDSGGWADVQWPRFSPNGSKIAYEKRKGYLRDGVPNTVVALYDTQTSNKKEYIQGSPLMWVDEEQIIVRKYDDDTNKTSYYLLNTANGESGKMN